MNKINMFEIYDDEEYKEKLEKITVYLNEFVDNIDALATVKSLDTNDIDKIYNIINIEGINNKIKLADISLIISYNNFP